jgi:hypothetical protein
MCLRRAPEKYIAGTKAPAGAALDRAALESTYNLTCFIQMRSSVSCLTERTHSAKTLDLKESIQQKAG